MINESKILSERILKLLKEISWLNNNILHKNQFIN
jgi:hypothetical protein